MEILDHQSGTMRMPELMECVTAGVVKVTVAPRVRLRPLSCTGVFQPI